MNALLEPRPARRRMTVADVDAVAAIEAAAYGHPWSRGNFIDSLAAGYLAEVLASPRHGLLGYFVAMPVVDELHLLNLTVAPAWQGQGLGAALIDAVEDHGRALGLLALWLEVRRSNERAQVLYGRRGFVEVGRRPGYYPAAGGRREDAIVMRCPLRQADALD